METEMPVRLIATDVDGTLLDSNGKMPEDNIRAIREAQKKGIIVAISSGRFVENVYLLLEDYDLKCPIIAVNGAKIVDENLNVLSTDFMDHEAAMKVYRTLTEIGSDYFVFGRDSLCAVPEQRKHHSELSQGERVRALGYGYAHGAKEAEVCMRQPIHKFYICDNVPFDTVRARIKNIAGIALTQSGWHNIEVMPMGIDKAYGVRKFAQMLGIPLSQVMTLGDQENDIPMLRAAGYGVAMGNASPETKAAAKYVTETNDQCGFARAIERLALKR